MKTPLSRLAAAVATAAAALSVVSCAYDPYYGDGGGYSYGGSYSSGGYYGGSSTSIFVSTGDSRWGYDPNRYCYYDYSRRAYYDPYLYGYYPVGFLPPRVYGVPHPYGWRPGHGYCPPPRGVRGGYISNYHNRYDLYRSRNYSWSNNIRRGDNGGRYDPNRFQANRPGQGRPNFGSNQPGQGRPGFGSGPGQNRPDFGQGQNRPGFGQSRPGFVQNPSNRPQFQPGNRPQFGGSQPSNRPQFQQPGSRPQFGGNQPQFPQNRPQFQQPSSRPQFGGNQPQFPQNRPQFQQPSSRPQFGGNQPQFPQNRPQFQPSSRPQFQPQQGRPQIQPQARPQQTRENNTLINSGGGASGQPRGNWGRGDRDGRGGR